MVLPQCNLFPHGLLPLHIFEPKYREMLRTVLETDRMFCIGTLRENAPHTMSIYHESTAGVVRASVEQADGCSNLLLQGVRRIALSDFQTDKPYLTAQVTVIETKDAHHPEVEALVQGIRKTALELIDRGFTVSDHVSDYLRDLDVPEVLGDLIAYHFIQKPLERQPLLGMASLTDRLQRLEICLGKQLAQARGDASS